MQMAGWGLFHLAVCDIIKGPNLDLWGTAERKQATFQGSSLRTFPTPALTVTEGSDQALRICPMAFWSHLTCIPILGLTQSQILECEAQITGTLQVIPSNVLRADRQGKY